MLNVNLISIVFGVLFLLSCGKNQKKSDSDIAENNQVEEESQEYEAKEEIEYIFGPCSVQRTDYKKFDINCSRSIEAIEFDSKITSESLEKNGTIVVVTYNLVTIDAEESNLEKIKLKIMHRDATVTPLTLYEKNIPYGANNPPLDTQENAFKSKSNFDSCRLFGNIERFSITCSEPIDYVKYANRVVTSSLFHEGCEINLERDRYLETWINDDPYDPYDIFGIEREWLKLDDRLNGCCRLGDKKTLDLSSEQDEINLEVVYKNGEVTKVWVSSTPTF